MLASAAAYLKSSSLHVPPSLLVLCTHMHFSDAVDSSAFSLLWQSSALVMAASLVTDGSATDSSTIFEDGDCVVLYAVVAA
jgi:hypothetical protein